MNNVYFWAWWRLPRVALQFCSSSADVSAGVCFGGKGRLHFVMEKTKNRDKSLLRQQSAVEVDRRL